MASLPYEPAGATVSHILYTRVSSLSQSSQAQREAMRQGVAYDREFTDDGISGAVVAANRPGFSAMLGYVREGDTVVNGDQKARVFGGKDFIQAFQPGSR